MGHPDRSHRRTTVVVATRDRRDALLRSLPRHGAPTIVVDNGSRDGSPEAVAATYGEIEVVRSLRNLGAPARNLGVAAARTPYVAFADDDSWWAPGALELAAELFDGHPRLALVAGRILVGAEQRLDPICEDMAEAPLGHDSDLPGPSVLGFAACGAIVRRDAFLSVGGFDDVVFFAGEEERVALDLADGGWGLAYVLSVVAHHHPSDLRASDERRRRVIVRNALLTACMRRPWSVVGRRALRALQAGGPDAAGVRDALLRFPAACRQRRTVSPRLEHQLRSIEA